MVRGEGRVPRQGPQALARRGAAPSFSWRLTKAGSQLSPKPGAPVPRCAAPLRWDSASSPSSSSPPKGRSPLPPHPTPWGRTSAGLAVPLPGGGGWA